MALVDAVILELALASLVLILWETRRDLRAIREMNNAPNREKSKQ